MSDSVVGMGASGLLQITNLIQAVKDNSAEEVLILGYDLTKKPSSFIISKKGLKNEMDSQLVIERMGLDSKVIAMDQLTINQFKDLLINIGVSPSLVLNNVNDFAMSIGDIAVDEGALFHDKEGNCLTVARLVDNRTLLDMLNGIGESNVMATFDGAIDSGGRTGETHSIAKIRKLMIEKELTAVF